MPKRKFEVTTIAQADMEKQLKDMGERIKLTDAELKKLYDFRRRLIAEARGLGFPDDRIAGALGVKRSAVSVVPRLPYEG